MIKLEVELNPKKGSGYILLVGVIIGLFTAGLVGYTAYTGGSRSKVDRIHDISTTIDSGILGNYIELYYLNQSLRYSLWNASYSTALNIDKMEGAHEEGYWEEGNLPEIEDIRESIEFKVKRSPYFKDYISKNCDLTWGQNYKLKITEPYSGDSFTYIASKDPIRVECKREDVQSSYIINATRTSENHGNRIFYLWNDTYGVLKRTKEDMEGIKASKTYGAYFITPISGSAEGSVDCEGKSDFKSTVRKLSESSALAGVRYEVLKDYYGAKKDESMTPGTTFVLENKEDLYKIGMGEKELFELFPGLEEDLSQFKSILTDSLKKTFEEENAEYQAEIDIEEIAEREINTKISLGEFARDNEKNCKPKEGKIDSSKLDEELSKKLKGSKAELEGGIQNIPELIKISIVLEVGEDIDFLINEKNREELREIERNEIKEEIERSVDKVLSSIGEKDGETLKTSSINTNFKDISSLYYDCSAVMEGDSYSNGCSINLRVFETESTLSLSKIRLETNSTDRKYVLPVSDGYKHLVFPLSYEYSFN